MDRSEIVELAEEIFAYERDLRELKANFTRKLVESEMTEFFSVDWKKLRAAAEGYPVRKARNTE